MKTMISAKQVALVAALAVGAGVVAQETVDEQRIAELIEQLRRQHGEAELADFLTALKGIEDAEANLQWIRESTGEYETLGELLSKARLILVESEVEGRLEPARRQVLYELLMSREGAGTTDEVKLNRSAAEQVEEDEGTATRAIRQRLRDTETRFRVSRARVDDWAAYFSDLSNVPFNISPGVRKMNPERTTLRGITLPVMSVERALHIIGDQTGVTYRIIDRTVVMVPSSEAILLKPPTPEQRQVVSREIHSMVQEAITALGIIGPAAKDAIPVLEKLEDHDDPQIAERAKAALRQVRGR